MAIVEVVEVKKSHLERDRIWRKVRKGWNDRQWKFMATASREVTSVSFVFRHSSFVNRHSSFIAGSPNADRWTWILACEKPFYITSRFDAFLKRIMQDNKRLDEDVGWVLSILITCPVTLYPIETKANADNYHFPFPSPPRLKLIHSIVFKNFWSRRKHPPGGIGSVRRFS